MNVALQAMETIKSFRETRLSALRPPTEFFDHHRISRPADFNTTMSRITYNTRYFSGNYGIIAVILAVYAIITNSILLISLIFLFGGFALINKYAPEEFNVGSQVITRRQLFIGLFAVGIPLLLYASPLGTFFWLVGAAGFVILFHAAIMEPGIESEYSSVEAGTGV